MMKAQRISWANVSRRITLVLLLLVCLPWPGQAAAPVPFEVSQTLDSGPYSLRAGIEYANSHPGPDIIRFHSNLTGRTILLNSNLPPLTDNGTTIDASPNWIGSWPTGEPGIGLTKNASGSTATVGLHIKGADNCLIKGLLIEGLETGIRISEGDDPCNRANGNTIGAGSPGGRMLVRACFGHAIRIQNSDSNRVIGCYIGTSKTGNLPEPNGLAGVYIVDGRFNEIGGTGPLEGNLIGASEHGVWIEDSNAVSNTVQANRIGIGTLDGDIGNRGYGVWIFWRASYNQVGGTSPETGNWISGNGYDGVMLNGFSSFNRLNWNDISDNDGGGINITQSDNNSVNWNNIAGNNTDGITIASANGNTIQGNTIVRNTQSGVYLWEEVRTYQNYILSNFIGTDASGAAGLGNGLHGLVLDDGARSNRVEGNVIAQNKESGIVIVNDNTFDNIILNNYIGLTKSGQPRGNTYYGVGVIGSPRNAIHSNIIAYNGVPAGVWISEAAAIGNQIWFNSIYNNTGSGIVLTNGGNKNLAAPSITQVQCPQVRGAGAPANGKVQLFSDQADEGRFYEGETTANSSGQWVYTGGFHGPHLTATAIDSENNTSAFSAPASGSFCGVIYLPVIRR
ncbi:MAG: right-handed parallel beta-helix repeat-containing protein [Anaerolineales bacterium]|nr:right-handed parallel beta-helix repeat-containing protein [Anaerolineales bacterium]